MRCFYFAFPVLKCAATSTGPTPSITYPTSTSSSNRFVVPSQWHSVHESHRSLCRAVSYTHLTLPTILLV